MSAIIVIPARLGSTRLKKKPLALLNNKPLILHVAERARDANLAPVLIAVDSKEVKSVVEKAGFDAVLTSPDLPSGSDRVWAALSAYDPAERFDTIINLQGDLPIFEAKALKFLCRLSPTFDIQTLAVPLLKEKCSDANTVKVVLKTDVKNTNAGEALPVADFRRQIDCGHALERHWHHIGVYAYGRHVLKRFVASLPASREVAERLEQLRAFELGLRIGVYTLPPSVWLSVDTESDLEKARALLKSKGKQGRKAS